VHDQSSLAGGLPRLNLNAMWVAWQMLQRKTANSGRVRTPLTFFRHVQRLVDILDILCDVLRQLFQ